MGQGADAFNYKLFYMLSLDMACIMFIKFLNVCLKKRKSFNIPRCLVYQFKPDNK